MGTNTQKELQNRQKIRFNPGGAPFFIATLSAILGLACATPKGPGQVGVPLGGEERSKESEVAIIKVHGFKEAVAQMRLAISQHSCETSSKRVAVAWEQGVPELEEFAREAATGIKKTVLVRDVGISSSSPEEIAAQLDPETFCGIWWLRGPGVGKGFAERLEMDFMPLGGGPRSAVSVRFSPSLLLMGGQAETADWPPMLLSLDERVYSAALHGDSGELWFVTADRLVRYSLKERRELQGWPLVGKKQNSPLGPAILRLFDSPGSGALVGLFAFAESKGKWFSRSGDSYGVSGELSGYPLSEKESRFLKTEYSPGEEVFKLSDFGGREIGGFVRLERMWGSGESVLVLQKPDGSLATVMGNTLEQILPPVDGKVTACAGQGKTIFLVEEASEGTVLAFSLRSGSAWESVWRSAPLPAKICAVCAASMDAKEKLVVIASDGKGGCSVYLLDFPGPDGQ